jgi:alkyl sulfatase BDS1-like metallo-beta-lactamase superfamily hydrolase
VTAAATLEDFRAISDKPIRYLSFPMLASPMKPNRPILTWAESVERMAKLPAEHLVPSHGEPLHGADKIVARASQAREAKNWQLIVELTDVTLSVDEDHAASHALRAEALEQLADASVNGVERNLYRAAAQDSHQKLKTATKPGP